MSDRSAQADVWLFFHGSEFAATKAHREQVARVCKSRNWSFQPRRVEPKRSPQGRPLPLVEADVAAGLYPRIHRQRVLALVIGTDPLVPLHPHVPDAIRFGQYVRLRRFIAYKSLWARLPINDPGNESWAGVFDSWCQLIDCDGEHDPRCLPFHVFSGNGRELHRPERRAEFDVRYGSGASRTDERTAEWRLEPRNFHAFQPADELHVSGCFLRRGCHWDVSAERYRIATPRGLWLVDGHVNIYPDASVRGRLPSVKKLI